MIGRLVFDTMRQWWHFYLAATLVIAVLWANIVANAEPTWIDPLRWGLLLGAGPLMALGLFSTREYAVLPVSRSDYWRARWLLGTVVVPTCAGIAQLLTLMTAMGSPLAGRTGLMHLIAGWIMDFSYCGMCFGLRAVGLAAARRLGTFKGLSFIASGMGLTLLAAGAIGGALGSVWFSLIDVLPAGWNPAIIVAVGQLALTAVGYPFQPITGPVTRRPSSSRAGAVPTPVVARGRSASGLTLLFQTHAARACKRAAVVIAISAVLRWRFRVVQLEWGAFDWIVAVLLAGGTLVPPLMRHLRTLPLSPFTLNGVLLALALPYWICLMAGFAILAVATTGALPHIDVASLMLAIAVTALGYSWHLAFPRQIPTAFQVMVLLALVLGVNLVLPWLLMSPLQSLVRRDTLALLALIVAAVANHLLLTRRTATYRTRPDLGVPTGA